MKEIYILVKPEDVERINEEVKRYQDIADVKIITDINEIPQGKRKNLEIAKIEDETINSFNSKVYDKMPEFPNVEELFKENKTEFQKLSSFDRKEKNNARKKLEHQALKYQNKHYKK